MAVRPIDGNEFMKKLTLDTSKGFYGEFMDGSDTAYTSREIGRFIEDMPTITLPNEWISVKDRLPELPDQDWCSVMVNTAKKGNPKSRLMIYERSIIRGKRVERWKYYWDRIADELPDYWMPLPKPPEE